MSDLLREQSTWRLGKTPIISKYAEEHAALMSAIAGRGFLNLPGYAYNAENRLEFATKLSLSELSFKIISETVERELKQTGINYDLSYKTALIAWELEKQTLMNAWEAELAGIKQNEAEEEEVLNLLAIEVQKRAITFTEAKTAIELSMEAYRKTLAELDGNTASYEVQLANAKLLTAQKKLEIIPILETILEKEQELLTIEQTKAVAYADYIAAEQQVSVKKGTLMPFINQLATKSETLATKIATDQIPKENLIANEKVAQASAAVTKAGYQIQELEADIETDTKRIDLMSAKRTLETTQFGYEQAVVSREKQLTSEHQMALLADSADAIYSERTTHTNILDGKKNVESIKNFTKLTSVNTITTAEKNAGNNATAYEVTGQERIAQINAAAKITASLEHLIK